MIGWGITITGAIVHLVADCLPDSVGDWLLRRYYGV